MGNIAITALRLECLVCQARHLSEACTGLLTMSTHSQNILFLFSGCTAERVSESRRWKFGMSVKEIESQREANVDNNDIRRGVGESQWGAWSGRELNCFYIRAVSMRSN